MQKNIKAGGGEVIRRYEAKRANMRKDLYDNSALIQKRQSHNEVLFPTITTRLSKSPLDARSNSMMGRSVELSNSDEGQNFSLDREFKLIKNSHQLLQAYSSRGSQVVRSCRSSLSTTDPMEEMTKLYKKINPKLPKLAEFE